MYQGYNNSLITNIICKDDTLIVTNYNKYTIPDKLNDIDESNCYLDGRAYNYNVNELPQPLTKLYLGRDYTQNIDNLPNTLTLLRIDSLHYTKLYYLPSSISNYVSFIQYNFTLPSKHYNFPNLINGIKKTKHDKLKEIFTNDSKKIS